MRKITNLPRKYALSMVWVFLVLTSCQIEKKGEMYNLAYDKAYVTKKNSMKAALDEWLAENGDDFYKWKPLPAAEKNTN